MKIDTLIDLDSVFQLVTGVMFWSATHMRFTRFYSIFPTSIRKRSNIGDLSSGGTPGSIPNPVVKSASADGTWGATPWESRSSPILSLLFFYPSDYLLLPALSISLASQ